MIVRRVIAVTALVAAIPAAALAADAAHAGAARALRTLSYAVDVQAFSSTESPPDALSTQNMVHAKGFTGVVDTPIAGTGERKTEISATSKGTIAVAVVQATEDAGLVLDVSEDADRRTRAKVRIVVGPDGAMVYDPVNQKNLTEEEVALARWLARGFFTDRPTDPGTAWTVDQSANGHTDIERYRVVRHDDRRVTLDYGLDEAAPGVTGYRGTRTGSLVYDTALIVPVKATFRSEAYGGAGGSLARTKTQITLTLTSDSFAAAAAGLR